MFQKKLKKGVGIYDNAGNLIGLIVHDNGEFVVNDKTFKNFIKARREIIRTFNNKIIKN